MVDDTHDDELREEAERVAASLIGGAIERAARDRPSVVSSSLLSDEQADNLVVAMAEDAKERHRSFAEFDIRDEGDDEDEDDDDEDVGEDRVELEGDSDSDAMDDYFVGPAASSFPLPTDHTVHGASVRRGLFGCLFRCINFLYSQKNIDDAGKALLKELTIHEDPRVVRPAQRFFVEHELTSLLTSLQQTAVAQEISHDEEDQEDAVDREIAFYQGLFQAIVVAERGDQADGTSHNYISAFGWQRAIHDWAFLTDEQADALLDYCEELPADELVSFQQFATILSEIIGDSIAQQLDAC